MQDEPDNCSNSSVEETSADVSSAYESSVHDEEEEDAREEAILSETDRVNLACPREFGHTKTHEVEQGVNGNAGTKMAIPKVSLCLERGKALQELNMIECACLIQTEKRRLKRITMLTIASWMTKRDQMTFCNKTAGPGSEVGNPLGGSNTLPNVNCSDFSNNNWQQNNLYRSSLVLHHRNVLETNPCA
jgi:hypothetical protein